MVGTAVFAGTVAGAGTERVVTTAVGGDCAVFEPEEFTAVTASRILVPRSTGVSVYVGLVAPAIAAHLRPDELQRFQEYPKVIGVSPFQVPGLP
jgi:hypothetical protein